MDEESRRMRARVDRQWTTGGHPFVEAFRTSRVAMILTDPRLDDDPIVFANDAFCRMTGYSREEIVGRNCRFLQGPGTDMKAVHEVRQALAEGRDFEVELRNYRKDGSPFWNSLFVSPVRNEHGNVEYHFGSQIDVSAKNTRHADAVSERDRFELAVQERTRELEHALRAKTALVHEVDHRVKNNLQMMASLVLLQGKEAQSDEAAQLFQSLAARLDAVGTVHRQLYQTRDVERFQLADFTREMVTDLIQGVGGDNLTVEFDLEELEVLADKATPIALLLNELATRAIRSAAMAPGSSTLAIAIKRAADGLRLDIRLSHVGDPPPEPEPRSFGQKLIDLLVRQLYGRCSTVTSPDGSTVTLLLPTKVVCSNE